MTVPFNDLEGEKGGDRMTATMARHRVSQIYWLLLATLPMAFIALLASILTYTSIRVQNDVAEEQRDRVIQLQKQLNDCLTPEGECARRGEANSRNLSTAISFCSATLPSDTTVKRVTECIVDVLEGSKP